MKFKNPLLAVKDMPASIDFYKRVLGLCVIMDFGANVTLTGRRLPADFRFLAGISRGQACSFGRQRR